MSLSIQLCGFARFPFPCTGNSYLFILICIWIQIRGSSLPPDYKKQEKSLMKVARRLSHPGEHPLGSPHRPVSKILLTAVVFFTLECLGNPHMN